jgi:hypothetical protein
MSFFREDAYRRQRSAERTLYILRRTRTISFESYKRAMDSLNVQSDTYFTIIHLDPAEDMRFSVTSALFQVPPAVV